MFDTVSATVTLLCVAMVLRNHYFMAGMMLGAATLLKLFPGFLIFVLAAYVLARHRDDGTSTRRLMEAASGAVVSVIILLLPQILSGDLSSAFAFLTERSGNMGTSIDGIRDAHRNCKGVRIITLDAGVDEKQNRSAKAVPDVVCDAEVVPPGESDDHPSDATPPADNPATASDALAES